MFASHRRIDETTFVEQMGVAFEDFAVGQVFEHRPGRTFTAEEVRQHALRSLDHAPVYVDEDYAGRSGVLPVAVPESFVLAVVAAMSTKTFARVAANLGWQPIEFGATVRVGDTLYAESEILGKRESGSRPDQGIMHVATRATNQRGETVCRYERKFLVYRSGQGPHVAAGY